MVFLSRIVLSKGEPKYGDNNKKVTLVFSDGSEWVPKMSDIERVCVAFGVAEEYHYKNGLGRNFFFLAHLFPIYKGYLLENGFKPSQAHLEKTLPFRQLSNVTIYDRTNVEVVNNGENREHP